MIHDSSRPSYVLFLTDGLPTAGETRELSIAENCRTANGRRSRVFCFGVGYDVNARLLDRLSGGNSGTSEYVKPDEDIESHVAAFYSEDDTAGTIGHSHRAVGGGREPQLPARRSLTCFEGGQIVWVGRYRQSGRTTIRVTGKVAGESRSLEFPAELAGSSGGSNYDFVERLWAVRRLGDLIDQIDLHGQNRELIDELVSLSTRYGILTPYTSFLADERVPLQAAANSTRAEQQLRELRVVTGPSGVEQRLGKQRHAGCYARRGERLRVRGPGPKGRSRRASRHAGAGGAAQEPARARRAPKAAAEKRGFGGLMGGGSGLGAAPHDRLAGRPLSSAVAADAKPDVAQAKVRRIGSKTFYWKKERWIDASVTDQEAEKATVITQLSDEYFQLARAQKPGNNQYLSLDDPITVKLDGKVYRIEPDKKDARR